MYVSALAFPSRCFFVLAACELTTVAGAFILDQKRQTIGFLKILGKTFVATAETLHIYHTSMDVVRKGV